MPDGGGASATLGYVFGAYPWAEQNFFYTWLSSTGEDVAPRWPHSAWLANYAIWNWIAAKPAPLEFGFGDTPHTTNELPIGQMYTHLANVRHLYGRSIPEAAALARHEDVFLHVLQVGDRRLEAMDPVELVSGDGTCGVRLARNDQTWTATFRTRGELGGHLRRTGGKEKEWDCELTNTVQPQQGASESAKSP